MMSIILRIIIIIIALLLIGGIIYLQFLLSKKESKWPGLILPLLTLICSIIIVSGLVLYTAIPGTITKQEISEDGTVLSEETTITHKPQLTSAPTTIIIALPFILYNIPTVILLAIYISCRGKRKRNLSIQKMKIQDLE